MEHCQFSETQFSFCFTFEFIKQFFPAIPLPIFPNTVLEGREGGGYDVQINGNVFIQFKIPVYYNLYSNFWLRDWNVFGHEYYKISLNTDGEQYRLLKALQSPDRQVFYATPEFYSISDMTLKYVNNEIVQSSAAFQLVDLPPHGSGYHHLIYSPVHSWGRLFSDPVTIKKMNLKESNSFLNGEARTTVFEEALTISKLIQSNTDSNFQFNFQSDNQEILVKQVYTVLLIHYNLHWIPVMSQPTIR